MLQQEVLQHAHPFTCSSSSTLIAQVLKSTGTVPDLQEGTCIPPLNRKAAAAAAAADYNTENSQLVEQESVRGQSCYLSVVCNTSTKSHASKHSSQMHSNSRSSRSISAQTVARTDM